MSPESINCAGLEENLVDADYTMKAPIFIPLMADVEAAREKAQSAYRKWMEYMTGVIWGLVTSVLSLVPQPKAYSCVSDSRSTDGFKRSLTWLLILFAG